MTRRTPIQRIATIGVIAALFIVAAIFDDPSQGRAPVMLPEESEIVTIGADPLSPPSQAALGHAAPVAPRDDDASSTWFCGGGAAEEGGQRDTTLILTNKAGQARRAKVAVTTEEDDTVEETVSVPEESSVTVEIRELVDSKWVGAVVESVGGGLTVTQRIGSGDTVTMAACATTSSRSWYFPYGDTGKGAGEYLVLFNPFNDLVTADVAFLTLDGFRQPQDFNGWAVPPGTMSVLDVTDVEDRKEDLASIVTTRAGRLIVWRVQTFDGSGPDFEGGFPPSGVSVTLGAPEALTHFVLPTAVTGEGVATRIAIANPGSEDSTVEVTLIPDDPELNGKPPATTLEVPATSVRVLDAEQLRQIPPGVPFSVRGQVVKGGPVVAELWLDGAEPARGQGAFAAMAMPAAAKSWVVPRGLGDVDIDQLGIFSPNGDATLTVTVVGERGSKQVVGGQNPESVASGDRISLDLMTLLENRPGATVLVEASQPVTVARLQAGADQLGLVSFSGLPVRGALVRP